MFPPRLIYLAGPISGLTHDEARYGWRERFVQVLYSSYATRHIHCYSPMRAKEFLKDIGTLDSDPDSYPENAMSTCAGITTRDSNDVKNCDAMVACFLESGGRPSLGTALEYGMAHAWQKPVIAVGPLDDPNIKHAMLRRVAGFRVDTLEEAAHIAYHLLTPGL